MKAGTQNHLKTKRLMRIAQIPLYRAVGILETLWLLCQDCCDEGNIGKFTDEEIADYLGWDGPSASDLVRHLADSGWIDPDQVHRYVVHDWLEECPEYIRDRVRKRRARASRPRTERTCAGSSPDKSGQTRTCPEMSEFVPSIPNQTQPNQTPPPPRSSSDPSTAPGQLASGEPHSGGGGLEVWTTESAGVARDALHRCGYVRIDAFIRECQNAAKTPAEVVSVCDEYRANSSRFDGPGAIADRLRSGVWPVSGVVSTAESQRRKSIKSAEKHQQRIASLRVRLIKAGANDARDWDEARIESEAKARGMLV